MRARATETCPLCRNDDLRPFAHVHRRDYFECATCGLVSMAPEHRSDPAEERAHYATHENNPSDPGYRCFLNRLAEPLAEHLHRGAEGLDYGSGPGPTLSVMLEEQDFEMEIYDPFFAPNRGVLDRTYDFITCTETAEHFFEPAAELDRLDRMLRPGGWLGVMTQLLTPDRVFEAWRYARDPTHVCFYRPRTMTWIARHYDWTMVQPGRDIVLFQQST